MAELAAAEVGRVGRGRGARRARAVGAERREAHDERARGPDRGSSSRDGRLASELEASSATAAGRRRACRPPRPSWRASRRAIARPCRHVTSTSRLPLAEAERELADALAELGPALSGRARGEELAALRRAAAARRPSARPPGVDASKRSDAMPRKWRVPRR